MQVRVNGEARRMEPASRLSALLEQLHLGQRRIAVEINGTIVPRSRHAETELRDGDEVLIVQAIGGG